MKEKQEQEKQRRQEQTTETTQSRTTLRPGLPRPNVQWSEFGNRITPTSLGSGADDSALHITNHYHNKYSQSGPRIGIRIPLRGRRETQTTTENQTQETAQERLSPARERQRTGKPTISEERGRGTMQWWYADDEHQIGSTPFGESRTENMGRGTAEGGSTPFGESRTENMGRGRGTAEGGMASYDGPGQPRRVVLWQSSLESRPEAYAPMPEVIPITDRRRVNRPQVSGSAAPRALPPGSGQGYLF